MKDQLFLLSSATKNEEGVSGYCPDCALVKGYLAFYPQVEAHIDTVVVGPQRPRKEIVEKLGEENQGAPVLILADASDLPNNIETKTANGLTFIDAPQSILNYLGEKYKGGMPL